MKLLLVEDDEMLGHWLAKGLREADYFVDWARDGDEGWHSLSTGDYDGVILDWMLPGINGPEILRRHRAARGTTPVLMLTARDATSDVVAALDIGADEYVVKPFEFTELLARLRALVRRRYAQTSSVLRVADLVLDLGRREVRRGGELIALTPREYALLVLLAMRVDRVVGRAEIWEKLYETDDEGMSNSVEVCISGLRRKVDRGRTPLIVTRRGHGYMLRGDSCDPPSEDACSS